MSDDIEPVEEAKEYLESAERDWGYLSGEERHGTVVQALDALERATDPSVCDLCGREVTLMGDGLCGICQPDDSEVSADAERDGGGE
ncbi:hypothetical protein J2752_000498 [Halarchaeum rubridurum]|uniref:Uncharacterized protein n=1 Tax=Halarchaeum rubridurum TaxID=489911 RepID=A0A830FRB3_9EURY|nr:hypothetical protein [Halarchaeum rubridurum]MBP1953617.1 hypothetical protein [Halarchaeum rubridurum]GGM63898.1 hypothetical protein GCM10009017_12470 [Halarchaeum rubridurum]